MIMIVGQLFDDDGRTALDFAKKEGYAEIIQIITEAMAKRKQKSE